jgi:hypothetical protein
MCKPSCCNDNGSQGAGIAAVAFLIGSTLVAAKIGPIVASIVHTVAEVIRLVALTISLAMALAVITWAAITIMRWQLRRKALLTTRTPVTVTRPWQHTEPTERPDCLACGGTATVLRAISGGRYQLRDCPVCDPAPRAG